MTQSQDGFKNPNFDHFRPFFRDSSLKSMRSMRTFGTDNRLTDIDNTSDKWQGGSKRAYMGESRENGFGDRFLGAIMHSSC